MINKNLRKILEQGCKKIGVPIIPVLDPVVEAMENYFKYELAMDVPGRQHSLSHGYFDRIGAMQFTLAHDDGQLSNDLEEADIILVGVSRTSKTPTAMYLANRGLKTANVPMVPNITLPPNLFFAKALIIGLTTSPERLVQIRKSRLTSVGETKQNKLHRRRDNKRRSFSGKKTFFKKQMANY